MHAENMDRFKLESFLKSFRNDSLVFNCEMCACRLNAFQTKTGKLLKEKKLKGLSKCIQHYCV
jgi:hypothetical protein